MQFTKAVRKKAKLRLALTGPSGSGKTYGALMIAKGLGGKIAVIDTEHGSASLYSHLCEFDTLELRPPYSPERYIEAIKAAEAAGCETLIIDSTTHEWNGSGGCLEITGLQLLAHRLDVIFQDVQLPGGQRHRRQPRRKTFQGVAQLKDIQRRRLCRKRPGQPRQLFGRLHEHAFARLHTYHAQGTEGRQGFTQRGPAHAQLQRQVALGGQRITRPEALVSDQFADGL